MWQVNWPTLWMSWRERELREVLVLPLIVGIMLVPIGLFSGPNRHSHSSLTNSWLMLPCAQSYASFIPFSHSHSCAVLLSSSLSLLALERRAPSLWRSHVHAG